LTVVYFHRKNPHKYISIEAYFINVRRHLPLDVTPVVAESRFYSQGLFKRLYNTIEAAFRQGDVNHITGEVHYLAILLRKNKTILTIHDLVFLQHPSPISRKILKYFWLTLPVKRAGFVTAVSEATKSEIIRHTDCSPSKITVVPTCIGAHFTRVDKPFNATKPVILQIGTAENKNYIRMAKALEGINCRLEIVGMPSGAYLQVLEACKIDFKVSSHLSDAEMLQKYVDCDLLLFASTYEGFGMPIIEANTVGRVVVTSNVSSMPEVAGAAACLVDPLDVVSIKAGIGKVIRDEDYRCQLIEAGYDNCKRFQTSKVSQQYTDLYKGIYK
jgi:glycosyltransferase involved in cell wall biosynthesis